MTKTVHQLIEAEKNRQNYFIELIASENYQSPDVLAVQSSVFANKYAEGFPGRRYYGGQENTDQLEALAIERAKALFHADHANVQALSGAAANLAVYNGIMQPGDSILGMDLSHGWHLTHGAPVTLTAKIYDFHNYKTKDGIIDYEEVERLAHEVKPKVILAGFSAYPRNVDWARFAKIAQDVGAIAFADVSHIGGFIAAGVLENPLDHGFHVLMTTTHKSLRGPRWAIIASKGIVSNPMKKPEDTIENIPTRIDRSVFPGTQWGPHMNSIAGIAVALGEAASDGFKTYANQALANAQVMAEEFIKYGYRLTSGGTDNHMIVVDFSPQGLNGRDIQRLLEKVGISSSASTIPDDPNPPYKPSGLRLGTPAVTTRGVKEDGMKEIVALIHETITAWDESPELEQIAQKVKDFCTKYPLPY